MNAGVRVWVWFNCTGWQPARVCTVGDGGLDVVHYEHLDTHEKLILSWEDATLSFADREPPQPPASVGVSRSCMSLVELKNQIVRGFIRPPAALVVDEARHTALVHSVDFELRRSESGRGLGLFALRDLPGSCIVTRYHGAVRHMSHYARIRQYSGVARPDWNRGEAAVMVAGSEGLALDGYEDRLSIQAAFASGDSARMGAAAERGLASVCATVQYSKHNCDLRWSTASGCLLLITRWAPGFAVAVKAGEELVAAAQLTVS
jgi:hypothetical protein